MFKVQCNNKERSLTIETVNLKNTSYSFTILSGGLGAPLTLKTE